MSDEEIHFARADEGEAASDRLRRAATLLGVDAAGPPMTQMQMEQALAKLSPPVAAALLAVLNTDTATLSP